MIIVSNHLLDKTHVVFPEDIVVRLNLAWMKSLDEARATLARIKHDIYLDYPQGRSKPPRPIISLSEALELADEFAHVKHFAVSNVESPSAIAKIRAQLPKRIKLVPKIESKKGVANLPLIMKSAKATHAMLDKEDLYVDVKANMTTYSKLVDKARLQAKKHRFKLLELQGVVFV